MEGGGKITMTLVDTGAIQVKDLQIHHVPIQCAHGKFKVRALGGLRVLGDGVRVDGRRKPQNGCDTGRVLWTGAASS